MVKVQRVFVCEMCGAEYDTADGAISCEEIPAKPPKYNVGDTIIIKRGDGIGDKAVIMDVMYCSPNEYPRELWHLVRYDTLIISDNDGYHKNKWHRVVIEGIDCD